MDALAIFYVFAIIIGGVELIGNSSTLDLFLCALSIELSLATVAEIGPRAAIDSLLDDPIDFDGGDVKERCAGVGACDIVTEGGFVFVVAGEFDDIGAVGLALVVDDFAGEAIT